MITAAIANATVFGLMGRLTRQIKIFIRQEIRLAKTELSEKMSIMGRNVVSLLIGGFVAYAGVIVLLGGLGILIGFALTQAGLSPMLAEFIGLATIGLIVAIVGYAFIAKALKSFSHESLVPKRTIQTIKELRGEQVDMTEDTTDRKDEEEQYKPSAEEMQARVEATESRMGETLEELGRRFTPGYIKGRIRGKVCEQPYKAGLIAMGVGLVSSLVVTRRIRRIW